jgi:predicted metal-binding membrane protein
MSDLRLETVLRRERIVVGVALTVLAAAAWLYLLHLPGTLEADDDAMLRMPGMPPMSAVAMPSSKELHRIDLGALTGMWAVMIVAMMTPAAAPMIATFAAVHRRRPATRRVAVRTISFVLGYLAVWTGFSVLAAIAQAWLHSKALLSAAMAPTTPLLGGALLIATGIYQWTPLKRACLRLCRSPLSFFTTHWREGRRGAVVMGLYHGLYCLGCCWALMALLFAAGVMNLAWVALLAVAVLVEKVSPRGELVGRFAGLVLFLAGVVLVSRGLTTG